MNFCIELKLGFGNRNKSMDCPTFIKLSESKVKDLEATRKSATITNYHTALNSFSCFLKEKTAGKESLTVNILSDYEDWLLSRKVSRNTIANYLRYLRALYHMLSESRNKSPFSKFSTRNMITTKRSLSHDDVRKLIQQQSSLPPSLSKYLDVFLFSIYTFGIPFVDLVQLHHSDIINNVITYNRSKTGKPVVIVLLPEAERIIGKYRCDTSDYLFPFISQKLTDSYPVYQRELARYNRALKEIKSLSQLNVDLTSYVARHTWASIAFESGVDVGIISQALGHTSLRTTQIYLRELNAEQMRSAGEMVLNNFSD